MKYKWEWGPNQRKEITENFMHSGSLLIAVAPKRRCCATSLAHREISTHFVFTMARSQLFMYVWSAQCFCFTFYAIAAQKTNGSLRVLQNSSDLHIKRSCNYYFLLLPFGICSFCFLNQAATNCNSNFCCYFRRCTVSRGGFFMLANAMIELFYNSFNPRDGQRDNELYSAQ